MDDIQPGMKKISSYDVQAAYWRLRNFFRFGVDGWAVDKMLYSKEYHNQPYNLYYVK